MCHAEEELRPAEVRDAAAERKRKEYLEMNSVPGEEKERKEMKSQAATKHLLKLKKNTI